MIEPVPKGRSLMDPDLTVTGGDGDGERTGYWTVTGPQNPHEVYGQVERSRTITMSGDLRDGFIWYLYQRTRPEMNSPSTYMQQIDTGEAASLDEALAELAIAWRQLIPYAGD